MTNERLPRRSDIENRTVSETDDESHSGARTSRRAFIRSGALAAGVAITGGSSTTVSGEQNGVHSLYSVNESDAKKGWRCAMRPHHFLPNSRFHVVESGVKWRSRDGDENTVGYVIEYDYLPSFRALCFAESGLEMDGTFRTAGVGTSPLSDRGFVGVLVEPIEER